MCFAPDTYRFAIKPLGSSKAFTLVELLVVIAIIGILVALLLRHPSRPRSRTTHELRQQLEEYGARLFELRIVQKELPMGSTIPTDKNGNATGGSQSGFGWCVLILPFIEDAQVSEAAVEAFKTSRDAYVDDGENGITNKLNGLLMPMYLCPSDPEIKTQIEKYGSSAAAKARKPMNYAGVTSWYFSRTGGTGVTAKQPGVFCVSSGNDLLGPNNFDGLMTR